MSITYAKYDLNDNDESEKCCCFRGNNAVLWGYFIAFMIPAVCGSLVFASPYILHEVLRVDDKLNQTTAETTSSQPEPPSTQTQPVCNQSPSNTSTLYERADNRRGELEELGSGEYPDDEDL